MTCSKFEAENFIYKQISTTEPLIIENVLSKISSEFITYTRLCSADLCQVWGRSELRLLANFYNCVDERACTFIVLFLMNLCLVYSFHLIDLHIKFLILQLNTILQNCSVFNHFVYFLERYFSFSNSFATNVSRSSRTTSLCLKRLLSYYNFSSFKDRTQKFVIFCSKFILHFLSDNNH